MIALKDREPTYLPNIDVTVTPYIHFKLVELIATETMKRSSYTERELVKNTLVLKYCTDIPNVEELDYDLLYGNGIVREVICNIDNYPDIDLFIMEAERVTAQLGDFLTALMKLIEKRTQNLPKVFKELKLPDDFKLSDLVKSMMGLRNDKK